MSVFKCKMCGGDLQITPDSTVYECEYCGSRQTVPTATRKGRWIGGTPSNSERTRARSGPARRGAIAAELRTTGI